MNFGNAWVIPNISRPLLIRLLFALLQYDRLKLLCVVRLNAAPLCARPQRILSGVPALVHNDFRN